MTNSLRDKIGTILHEWSTDIMLYNLAPFSPNYPAKSIDIADRIIALLPKVPELRWLGDQLFLGSLRVGFVAEDRNGQMLLHAGEKTIGGAMPIDVARAAVEVAVRKALGWEV